MRSTPALPLAPLLLLCACGGPVVAPEALQDLSSYFYARWPDEDPAAVVRPLSPAAATKKPAAVKRAGLVF